MSSITLTALPIFTRIEAVKAEDGTIVLHLRNRAYVGSTPVDMLTVLATFTYPQDWDGSAWETTVAAQVEADYSAAGYLYPA